MTTKEAIAELERRGAHVSYWRLRGHLERGEIPKPRINSSFAYDWSLSDVRKAERVLKRKQRVPA